MARTTVDLDKDLLSALKTRAAMEHTTVRELLNRLLRAGLRRGSEAPLAPLPSFDMGTPAVDISDRDALYALMDRKG